LLASAVNAGVENDLTRIQAALAELSEPQLHVLVNATKGLPQTAPSLLAWIEAACDWEPRFVLGAATAAGGDSARRGCN
jgi:UDP-N-acetylmuramate-alanine ligase